MIMKKVMKKIFVGTLKMIRKVFLRKKILGDISVQYLGNISGKNLRGVGDLFSNAMNQEQGNIKC
jgi:hypothetical protein